MIARNFLQDFLGSIVSPRNLFGDSKSESSMEELCHELVSNRGEASAKRIGSSILARYQEMDRGKKIEHFRFLTEEFDLNAGSVIDAASQYENEKTPKNLKRLLKVSEPPRQELLRRLNRVPGATQALVSMRADLLGFLADEPTLKRSDLDFEHLLGSWFNRGFLELRRISWKSPANVLAKIIQYEAVHAINDWNDLQRRLQPSDRRCFAFFHPSMPDEPLVFVEIALCKGIPNSVQSVLDENRELLNEADADTAVFYSISNCQKGLRGVSFGNSLIKQVAIDLSAELENLTNFVTLSPIPGLARWVESQPAELPEEVCKDLNNGINGNSIEQVLGVLNQHTDELKSVAAKYLLQAKRDDGYPLDPVARFHLGNGASIYQVHAMADTSSKGLKQSFAVMVNYLYDMTMAETQHEDFAVEKIVHASKQLRSFADATPNRVFNLDRAG